MTRTQLLTSAALLLSASAAQATVLQQEDVNTGGVYLGFDTPCGPGQFLMGGVDQRQRIRATGEHRTSNVTGVRSAERKVEAGGVGFTIYDADCNPITEFSGHESIEEHVVYTDGTTSDGTTCTDLWTYEVDDTRTCPLPYLEFEHNRVWYRGTFHYPSGHVIEVDILAEGGGTPHIVEHYNWNPGEVMGTITTWTPSERLRDRIVQRIHDIEIPLAFTTNVRITVATPPRISGTLRFDGVDIPLETLRVDTAAIVDVLVRASDRAGDSNLPY